MKCRTPLRRSSKPLRRTPIKRVGKKRQSERRIYGKLVHKIINGETLCAVNGCENVATECHHRKGRGIHYIEESSLMPICSFHHRKVHSNPSWAREFGYLLT